MIDLIRRRELWKDVEAAECATLSRFARINNRRLLELIVDMPHAELEQEDLGQH
jgi:hypothetical protein